MGQFFVTRSDPSRTLGWRW